MCVASTVGPLTAYRSRGLYVVYPDATSRIRPITAYRLHTFIPMRVYTDTTVFCVNKGGCV